MVGGSATYRERIALSPEAVFEARLEDVSLADAPSELLGRTRIDAPGQVPIRFAIAYDPTRIDARRTYIVRATIRDAGRLAFTTDRIYRPFVDGRPQPLQLVLRAVSAIAPGGAGAASGADVGAVAASGATADAQSVPDAARVGSAAGPAAAGAARLGTLPANFGGVLPCADCQGIRQSLDLFADGVFHWRSTYLGKPAAQAPDDVGRWLLASDGRTLLLFGGREAPVRFVLRDDGALRLLDLEGRPIQSSFNYELRRAPGAFAPFEPRATLRGAYVYFADAPTFTDCATGQQMPVAQEADALALERAYTAAKQPPAAPRLAVVEGRIAQRMPMEGPGPRPTLVVERFLRLGNAGETCPAPPANAPLAGTRWRLTRLDGANVVASDRRGEAWLQFDAAQSRVAGSGGCNTISGSYALDGAALQLSKVAGTMMACRDEPQQERAFVAMLGQVRRWLVAGTLLEFIDSEDRLLARFEAAPATLPAR
jgi:uncharacterized lipoprotein YbaY/heat shock protein HslJ